MSASLDDKKAVTLEMDEKGLCRLEGDLFAARRLVENAAAIFQILTLLARQDDEELDFSHFAALFEMLHRGFADAADSEGDRLYRFACTLQTVRR